MLNHEVDLKGLPQINVTNTAGATTPVVSTSAVKVKTDPTIPHNTRIRARQKAVIQLLETIPEDLLSDCDSDEDNGDGQTMYKPTQSESEFEIDTEAEEALNSDLDNEQ